MKSTLKCNAVTVRAGFFDLARDQPVCFRVVSNDGCRRSQAIIPLCTAVQTLKGLSMTERGPLKSESAVEGEVAWRRNGCF